MNDLSITPVHDLLKDRLALRTLRQQIRAVMKMLALFLIGLVTYFICGLSARALICFDRTYIDSFSGWPVDYVATLLNCLGPLSWLISAGIFFMASLMALTVYRWSWPLRTLIVAAPQLFLVYNTAFVADLHSWVRPVCVSIAVVEAAIAATAAILCRSSIQAAFVKKWPFSRNSAL